ncbi:MAG: ornithine cyclodeaminase family protein [Caulobacteraceae bacterium]
MLILSKNEIGKLVTIQEIIPVMEKVFADYTMGKTIVPIRTKIPIDKHNGNILFMPALIPESGGLGVKVVSVYPENAKKGRQTIYSILMLNDMETGEPLALMDAELLTAIRTGAVSGVAAKHLARDDSKVVSIFGAGVQAKTQLEAICAVRDIERVYVFNRSADKRKRFIEDMSGRLGIQLLEGTNEKLALGQSDIIITATTSNTPVFNGGYVREGTFIAAVGGYTPAMQEVPEELVRRAAIIVDAYNASLKEAGDILIPMEKGIIGRDGIKGELGEVMLGKIKRESAEEIVFFKSVGLAIQDMSVAIEIYRKAVSMGMGIQVEI